MKTKTIEPLKIIFGIDEQGNPVTFENIIDDPFQGWSKIHTFTHTGAMAYFTARLYRRDIPEHDFFKVKNKAIANHREARPCQH